MKIVCAHSVTAAEEAFSTIGQVELVHETEIRPEHVREADVLVTRSKTKITRVLVAGSGLRAYATCTAGSDHVDKKALEDEGIAFHDAKGCNANAVSEYLTAALLTLASRYGLDLSEEVLGIIGHGHVGKAVAQKAEVLGLPVLLNDPPLEAAGGTGYVSLPELLERATILTLHVPLVEEGPWPTRNLLNAENLPCQAGFLINTCRGEVVDTQTLLRHRPFRGMVLDVWEPEPDYPTALFDRVDFGSPHVAGHSVEGKIGGTLIAYRRICRTLGLEPSWSADSHFPPLPDAVVCRGLHPERAIRDAVASCVRLRTDHNLMSTWPESERGGRFTERRRNYPLRREFPARRVRWDGDTETHAKLEALGFSLDG